MSSDPTLLQQLLNRISIFKQNFPSISQNQIARHIGTDEGNLSSAIAGKRGLSADSVLRLHKLFNLSKRDVLAVFSKPEKTSRILCLQEQGTPMMRLDAIDGSGWVPGLSGTDPDSIGSDDPTLGVLREIRSIHRRAIKVIDDFVRQAKVNRQGGTPVAADAQQFSRRS